MRSHRFQLVWLCQWHEISAVFRNVIAFFAGIRWIVPLFFGGSFQCIFLAIHYVMETRQEIQAITWLHNRLLIFHAPTLDPMNKQWIAYSSPCLAHVNSLALSVERKKKEINCVCIFSTAWLVNDFNAKGFETHNNRWRSERVPNCWVKYILRVDKSKCVGFHCWTSNQVCTL